MGEPWQRRSSHRARKRVHGRRVLLQPVSGCLGSHASNPEAGAAPPQPGEGSAADRVLFGAAENMCAVPAQNRVDCGYPDISSEQCINRGCCFDSSVPEVPWCFKPLQDTGKWPRGPASFPGSLQVPRGPPHTWTGQPAPWPSVGEGASARGIVHRKVSRRGLSPAVPLLRGSCRL